MTFVTCAWVIEHGAEVQRNDTVSSPRRASESWGVYDC